MRGCRISGACKYLQLCCLKLQLCIAILNNEVAALLSDYYTEVRHYNNIIVNTEM